MGQFSVVIYTRPGSLLSGNQQWQAWSQLDDGAGSGAALAIGAALVA